MSMSVSGAFSQGTTDSRAKSDEPVSRAPVSRAPGSQSQVSQSPVSQALAKNSDARSKTIKLAKFHTTRNEFKEAAQLWSKLAESRPDAYAEAYLGWCHLQMGNKILARQHIDKSIRLNPKSIEGYRYLGYYLIAEGKVPEAVKAFRTSMAYDPHHKCNCGDLEKLVLSKSKKRGSRG